MQQVVCVYHEYYYVCKDVEHFLYEMMFGVLLTSFLQFWDMIISRLLVSLISRIST